MTPEQSSQAVLKTCQLAPVVPVLVINDASTAGDLANALVEGGLYALEVTLRTDAALSAIEAMAKIEGAQVGAGTLVTPENVRQAKEAGATFGVSPGSTDSLLSAAEAQDLPMLPGAATASEAMALAERGYSVLKFFPAENIGGAGALKSLGGPLPHLTFCPTGGISVNNAVNYLTLPNVACVGGSWVAPKDLVAARDWAGITALAKAASQLGS